MYMTPQKRFNSNDRKRYTDRWPKADCCFGVRATSWACLRMHGGSILTNSSLSHRAATSPSVKPGGIHILTSCVHDGGCKLVMSSSDSCANTCVSPPLSLNSPSVSLGREKIDATQEGRVSADEDAMYVCMYVCMYAFIHVCINA